jgi:hypothetical protein
MSTINTAEIGEAEKREATQRVLASHTFHRSDQLKSLLRYLCEREIEGRVETLDEYAVAVEALGRPRDYSAFEDGAARNRVHHLRRRLEHYYETEGTLDPLHIILAKGSYCPAFQRSSKPAPPALSAAPATELPVAAPAARSVSVRMTILCCACALLLGVAIAALVSQLTPPGVDPVLAEAWGPLLTRNGNPLICIATAAQLTAIQRPVEGVPHPNISSTDLQAWYESLPGLPPMKEVHLGPSLTSPFWGDVAAAFAASHVLIRAGIVPEALPEPAIQIPALKSRNVLLFGRPGFSRAIDLYLRDKPFRVRIPDETHRTTIENVQPRPGEPSEFDAHPVPGREDTAYGLITVMPSWGGSNLRTVLFSGTLSAGTQAASEFFSSAKRLRELRALFQRQGYSGFPASYQVIIRSNIFGTSALDGQYVTHRVIARPEPRNGGDTASGR